MKLRFQPIIPTILTLCGTAAVLTSCADYDEPEVPPITKSMLISRDYFPDGSTTLTSHASYEYDAQGRCIHILVTDASQNFISSTDITYAERQIIETKQEGTTETAHFTYTLDEAGRITFLRHSSNRSMTTETAYDYDKQGHLIHIISNPQTNSPDTIFLTWKDDDIVMKKHSSADNILTITTTSTYSYGETPFQFIPSESLGIDVTLFRTGFFGILPAHQILRCEYNNIIRSSLPVQLITTTYAYYHQYDAAGHIVSYDVHETNIVNSGIPTEKTDHYDLIWMETVISE